MRANISVLLYLLLVGNKRVLYICIVKLERWIYYPPINKEKKKYYYGKFRRIIKRISDRTIE